MENNETGRNRAASVGKPVPETYLVRQMAG